MHQCQQQSKTDDLERDLEIVNRQVTSKEQGAGFLDRINRMDRMLPAGKEGDGPCDSVKGREYRS